MPEKYDFDNMDISISAAGTPIRLQVNDETAFGEPAIWLGLSDDTSVEITHEEESLREDKQFFSIRRHCSEADFDAGEYKKTVGCIEQIATTDSNINDLIATLSEYFTDLAKKEIYIKRDTENLWNYYFTFGTDKEYPYGIHDYVCITAESEPKARDLFKEKYPNRPGSPCLNFAFCYDESEFKDIKTKYYHDKDPVETIVQTL